MTLVVNLDRSQDSSFNEVYLLLLTHSLVQLLCHTHTEM